jgi:hypothetical protein
MFKKIKKGEYSRRMILQEDCRNHEVAKQKIVKTKFTNAKVNVKTVIFGNNISIPLAREKPLTILIKKEVTESCKNYFELLWESIKP